MIFSLVPPVALIAFAVVSVLAFFVHARAGYGAKVPMTFVVMVAASLYAGSQPYGEPFPGALTFIVWAATAVQAAFAAATCWVKGKGA